MPLSPLAVSPCPLAFIIVFTFLPPPLSLSPPLSLPLQREELARKAASKTHRQRVDELNSMLSTMTEHYDLFRISYAGSG